MWPPGGGEAQDVADEGDECGGGHETDPWDGAKARHHRSLFGQSLQLLLRLVDLFSQGLDPAGGGGDGAAQTVGNPGIGAGDQEPHLGQDVLDALGDEEAQLAEQTAEGVHLGNSRGDPARAETVDGSEDVLGDGLDRVRPFRTGEPSGGPTRRLP